MVGFPAVEGRHKGVILHEVRRPPQSRCLPSLVLPFLQRHAEAAVLEAAGSLLQDCLAALLPVGNATPLEQYGVPIALEPKGHSQANLGSSWCWVRLKPILPLVVMLLANAGYVHVI